MPYETYTRAEIDAVLAAQSARIDALELLTDNLATRVAALEDNPAPPDPGVAFMSRPPLPASLRQVSNASDVVIDGGSIQGGTVNEPAGMGIRLFRVKRAVIRNIDFQNLIGGFELVECEDVVVEYCRGRNIGNGQIGSGRSNYVQYNTSVGGAVRYCKFLGGRTEDMISTWRTGGRSASNPFLIEDNQLEGLIADSPQARAWTSRSGTGAIASDGSGSSNNGNITIRRNSFLNVGQVAVQHIDGPNLITEDNIIIGERYSLNNQPWASWEGSPTGFVRNNRYNYVGPDGAPRAGWFHKPGMVAQNNIRDTSLNPADYRVRL